MHQNMGQIHVPAAGIQERWGRSCADLEHWLASRGQALSWQSTHFHCHKITLFISSETLNWWKQLLLAHVRAVLRANTFLLSAADRKIQAIFFPKAVESCGPSSSHNSKERASFTNLRIKLPGVRNRNSYVIPSLVPTAQQWICYFNAFC